MYEYQAEIEGYQENRKGYCLIDREFELSEIRLLCEAVAASDMVQEETGKEIIRKLIAAQGIFQGRMLQKTVFVKSEKRILSKRLFYNIDALNAAINQGCKVCARMMEYGMMGQKLQERSDSPVIFSPYATLWAKGNYYVLAKRENEEELEHFRIDFMRDILVLERGVDMIFGGLHPGQYAKQYILQNGENKEKYEITCGIELWQEIAEMFGKDAAVLPRQSSDVSSGITVKILSVPSEMRAWVLRHVNEVEIVSPKRFRDEIQRVVMEAYKRYWK